MTWKFQLATCVFPKFLTDMERCERHAYGGGTLGTDFNLAPKNRLFPLFRHPKQNTSEWFGWREGWDWTGQLLVLWHFLSFWGFFYLSIYGRFSFPIFLGDLFLSIFLWALILYLFLSFWGFSFYFSGVFGYQTMRYHR
jgi:hypothetical protein